MICPACEVDMHPCQSLTNAGLMPTCVACGAKLPALLKDHEPIRTVPTVVAQRPIVVLSPGLPAQAAAQAPTDILGLAKARLADVRASLAKFRDLEAEERMLVAMVSAAEPTTPSPLKITN